MLLFVLLMVVVETSVLCPPSTMCFCMPDASFLSKTHAGRAIFDLLRAGWRSICTRSVNIVLRHFQLCRIYAPVVQTECMTSDGATIRLHRLRCRYGHNPNC